MRPLALLGSLAAAALGAFAIKRYTDDADDTVLAPSLAAAGIAPPPTDSFSGTGGVREEYGATSGPKLPAERAHRISQETGVTPEAIQAFAMVESRGDDGAIRFEPHLYLKRRPEFANVIPYTPKSATQAWDNTASHTNKAAFEVAFALDRQAAVDSASFGRFQVMGLWLSRLYADPLVGYTKWRDNPGAVSDELLIAWLNAPENRPVKTALKSPDWHTVARRYNGPGQVDVYKTALAAAHADAVHTARA